MDCRGRRENSPGPYMYAQDGSGCLSPCSDPEGMLCTLDDKERLRPFCFSLQHGVGHGKRLCPSWEGAGGCGCNWAAVLVCVLWHCSVIHSPQGMALQRLCVLFRSQYPSAVQTEPGPLALLQTSSSAPGALFFGVDLPLCRGVAPMGLFWDTVSPVHCGSWCICMSMPSVMDVRLH